MFRGDGNLHHPKGLFMYRDKAVLRVCPSVHVSKTSGVEKIRMQARSRSRRILGVARIWRTFGEFSYKKLPQRDPGGCHRKWP